MATMDCPPPHGAFAEPGFARCYLEAPPGFGLRVSLDSEGICWMQFLKDKDLKLIHPHIHVPSTLQHPEELGGGGSGVTIIRGDDKEFGDVVMKHGGHKDTLELFALATIDEQLRIRGHRESADDAATAMEGQIPDFKFIYISQEHMRDRGAELWGVVKEVLQTAQASPVSPKSRHHRRDIRICGSNYDWEAGCDTPVHLNDGCLEVKVDAAEVVLDDRGRVQCSEPGRGYAYLQAFVKDLVAIQRSRVWKFTLAQKTIGGTLPSTGSALLAAGSLTGDRLSTLIGGYVGVMRQLQELTHPEERDVADEVRRQIADLGQEAKPAEISELVDAYVGFAVKKNFHHANGRFKKLRDLGEVFRSGNLVLTDRETLPAKQLGVLFKAGARLEEVFISDLQGQTALDASCGVWRDLLEHATSVQDRAALSRIWTCGLTDSGLHNLFLGEDQLWLFDMGEPALMALPAFLTKFLMSFFHTLGMEEASCGAWVNRFEPIEGVKCSLTPATNALLPKVYDAFRTTLRSLVDGVFGGEGKVGTLLVRYVVLQLISDCAFCLERWGTKGGGTQRLRPQAQNLEKWLWRALWDMYISSDVISRDWSSVT